MKFRQLIQDQRTAYSDKSLPYLEEASFDGDIKSLKKYRFWSGRSEGPKLWEHQIVAISTVTAYLNSDNRSAKFGGRQEAALLKLPTGTGKSGIIAVISRCLPRIKRVLVLTPRRALSDQLLRDIKYRFWGHMGCKIDQDMLFCGSKEEIGQPLDEVFIDLLLPTNSDNILSGITKRERAVLVGTHQSLQKMRKIQRSANGAIGPVARVLEQLATTFDLIVVDEGHYEPAISWSRGVRELDLPTVLLSATPYRNDYKSFRVQGRHVFNYPYAQALKDKIVRPAKLVECGKYGKTKESDPVKKFVAYLNAELPSILEAAAKWTIPCNPKVMVRGGDCEKLVQLQVAIEDAFNHQTVLIHERARDKKFESFEGKDRRFRTVKSAQSNMPDATFWIHQYKLMEGIDDPSFVVIAIFDLMENERQLVQQIGRVTRCSAGDQESSQEGYVIANPDNRDRISKIWKRYTGYEKFLAKNTNSIVTNEVALPDRLLEYMPEYQYIAGKFRRRYELESPLNAKDIQVPLSAAIFVKYADYPITQFATEFEEAILNRDRFTVSPLEGLPQNTIGYSYYAWRNSPYLADRFFSEWNLGLFLAIDRGDFVFMYDTEGLVVDITKANLGRVGRQAMEKMFPASDGDNKTRLSRFSFKSLEMSSNAIRSMAIRTRSFEDTFTDLLDPSLVPAATFGFVANRGRYIGFAKSRVRDSSDGYNSFDTYTRWTGELAEALRSEDIKRNQVFDRYATLIENISEDEAKPISMLLDPSLDSFFDFQEDIAKIDPGHDQIELDFEDLCVDVDPETGTFELVKAGTTITGYVEYLENSQKYRIMSSDLDAAFPTLETEGKKQPPTFVQRLNKSQSFRLLINRPNTVYVEGQFFEPKLNWVDSGVDHADLTLDQMPILADIRQVQSLSGVDSEKGQDVYEADRTRWYKNSIFGIMAAICERADQRLGIPSDLFVEEVNKFDYWLCDDDSTEKADFIGFNPSTKKLVFLHAKVGHLNPNGRGYNVPALQDVGRQALASLAFASRKVARQEWLPERWDRPVTANTITLDDHGRKFRVPAGTTSEQVNDLLGTACSNPIYQKEIWIVGAKMLDQQKIAQELRQDPPSPSVRQLLMHWDSMVTACARANVRLKFFG